MQIAFNSFVRRQVADSRFGHTTLSERAVLDLLTEGFGLSKPSYREGVILVPVPAEGFFASTTVLKEGMKLKATYEPRRKGEEPRLNVGIDVSKVGYEAAKSPAVACDIVLYASTVLAENGDNELPASEGNWEVVSINPRLCVEEEPIRPGTLMANHFCDDGGTATGMSDSEFVEALRKSRTYWNGKISLG
jgi:hypothetical protein